MKMNHLFMTGVILLSSGALTSLGSVVHADDTDNSVKTTGDVRFIEDTNPTDPIDPTDPTDPVDPTDPITPTEGPLSIDYASSFHFDEHKISAKDEIYTAAFDTVKGANGVETRPNWIQVTDKRGTNAGWKLQVTQVNQFTTGEGDAAKELKGAELTLKNAASKSTPDNKAGQPTTPDKIDLVVGGAFDVMTAAKDQGMGTWLDVFGDETTGDKSIELMVPGAAEKVKDATYKTDLTWTLTDTPA